jgi:hypothetical protein
MNNFNLSSKENTISSKLIANKDYIAESNSKEEAIARLKEVLEGCTPKKVDEIIRAASSKKDTYKIIQYVWDIILKGDGDGSIESSITKRRKYH